MAKVLLVEDDNNLREIYEARLTAEGYEIITAQNGEEALSAAKLNKPDLIISDVMMPRISGFEMLDILRNTDELKNTKVIMLTALGQAEDRNRADNLGADKYLVKSQVTLEDIVNAAKELLSDTPGQITMPTVPQATSPVPDPVVTPVAADPASVVPDEPAATSVVAAAVPVDMPDPVIPEPLVMTPVDPIPATEPVAQTEVAVATEPGSVPEPMAPSANTMVTVTDPDPITQRIPAPVETSVPESAPIATPQIIAPDPVAPDPIAPEPMESMPFAPSPATEPVEAAPEMSTEPQTLAAEEAAIEAQIASFAASDQPPAPVAAPTANDAILDDAINKLTASPDENVVPADPTPITQPEPTAPVTEPVVEPTDQTIVDPAAEPVDTTSQISGRKVIQPLSDAEAGTTNLDVLLAQEEAKEAAQAPSTPQAVVTSETPAEPPRPGFDPNSIAL